MYNELYIVLPKLRGLSKLTFFHTMYMYIYTHLRITPALLNFLKELSSNRYDFDKPVIVTLGVKSNRISMFVPYGYFSYQMSRRWLIAAVVKKIRTSKQTEKIR